MTDEGGIRRAVELSCSSRRVWSALTEAHELSAWFGAEVELDLRPGGLARFLWPDGTARRAIVEVVVPQHHLVLRWLPFEEAPDGGRRQRRGSRIAFTIEDRGPASRLTIIEEGGASPLHPGDAAGSGRREDRPALHGIVATA